MASTVQRDSICRRFIIVFVVYYLWLLENLKLNRWQTSAYVSGKGKGGGQKESKQDHPHEVPLSPYFTCMIMIFPLHEESLRFCTASFPLTLLPAQTFPKAQMQAQAVKSELPDTSPAGQRMTICPLLSLVQMSSSGGPFWLKLGEHLKRTAMLALSSPIEYIRHLLNFPAPFFN